MLIVLLGVFGRAAQSPGGPTSVGAARYGHRAGRCAVQNLDGDEGVGRRRSRLASRRRPRSRSAAWPSPAVRRRRRPPGLGFAPDSDAAARSVALRQCPLLDAARRYPDIVCGVHLGMVQGALEVLGADARPARLEPFAEPGACRLVLARDA
jgi:hypothetical protein